MLNPSGFKQLSVSDKESLERDFSVDEIRVVVAECGSDKAPGPDGFSLTILKHIWDVIEANFVEFIHEFQSNGKIVRGLNSNFIVLIPKCSNPTSLYE